MGKSRQQQFSSVDEFLTYIGRSALRERGFSHARMANWSNRDRHIPARNIPIFKAICAEHGIELPMHLFNVDQSAVADTTPGRPETRALER